MRKTLLLIGLIFIFFSAKSQYDINGDYKISGKLGIGTTTLTSKVNINGEINNFSETGSIQFKLQPLSNNYESYFTAFSGDGSSWARFGHSPKSTTNAMFFNTSASKYWFLSKPVHIEGDLGIGTANPQAKLSLGSTVEEQKLLIYDNGNYRYGFGMTSGSMRIFYQSAAKIEIGTISNSDGQTFSRKMIINSSGNVGIGTSSLNSKLNVNGEIYNFSETGSIKFKLKPKDNDTESYFTALSGDESSWARFGHSPKSTTNAMFFNTSASKYWFLSKPMHIEGKVGIGTSETGTHKLAVDGTIGAREIVVEAGTWSDFVFNTDYKLKDLEEVEIFIEENKHLPDIPSEKEVKENGVQVGEMNAKLLQKIEELTLYMIDINKRVKLLEEENKALKEENSILKTQ